MYRIKTNIHESVATSSLYPYLSPPPLAVLYLDNDRRNRADGAAALTQARPETGPLYYFQHASIISRNI